MASFYQWKLGNLFVILTAYLDEAGTHKGAPFTVMAGYLARSGQWQHFNRKWERLLQRHGVSHAHATDLLQGRGEFRGWTYERAERFLLDMEKAARRHLMFGFSAQVSDHDYREIYVGEERPKKIPLDTRYGLCLRLILSFIPRKILAEEARSDLILNFVLEAGSKNAGDAVRVFELFKKHAPPDLAKMSGTITFAEKTRFPGLQAADGIASSVYRLETRRPEEPFYFPENVFDEPIAVGRARTSGETPVYRLEASSAVLRELRDNITAQIDARRQFGERRRNLPFSSSEPL